MSDSGSKLGHYTVGEFLGKGAFSRVYVGMHDESGQLCALKLLDKASVAKAADSMRQVQRELAALSKIDNVNVLKLYDVEWNVHFVRPSGQPSEVRFDSLIFSIFAFSIRITTSSHR
jgi:serine/threonine protein kinase